MGKKEVPHVNLMICTPGHSMMAEYVKSLLNWNALAAQEKVTWGFSTGYSSHVGDAREIALSGTKENNIDDSRPFEGNVTYDKIMWIDSDIEFRPEDILALYKSEEDIISGAYLLANGQVVVYKDGNIPYSIEEIEKLDEITEVAGAGFGFICIKKGVFENLSRPWFQSVKMTVELKGKDYEFPIMGEDLSFCARIKEKGYKIYLDPSVKVNHHKMMKLTWKGIQPNG